MSNRPTVRAMVIAGLIATLGAGCAKAPFATQPYPAAEADSGMDALSKPVNQEAVKLAKSWQRDAVQVGVMINRSARGVQDTATYVFGSNRARQRMLIVIASKGGLTAQELAVNDRAAEGLANSSPLTNRHGKLLSSKKVFKKAEHAGLRQAEDMVVVNTRIEGKTVPVAIVTDQGGDNYIVMDAVTGEPMSPVSKLSGRRVQAHLLIIGGVVLAVAVGAAVWWAVKKWRQGNDKPDPKPSPLPSDKPTPIPSATPVPTPVPSSKPSGRVAEILAGPFGDMFDRLDTDKDRLLTITEFLRPAKDATTEKVKTNEWREFIDVRHTGKVDRNAFLMGVERSVNSLCDMSFSMLDANQNAGLDSNEIGTAIPAGDFREADTNRDGQLSRAEYVVPFAKKESLFAPHYK